MSEISEIETVRVVRLNDPSRPVIGSGAHTRQPQVGDVGTVVSVMGGGTWFTVECVNSDGKTSWLCDFDRAEIEPFTQSDRGR